jgi:hypothetical protein
MSRARRAGPTRPASRSRLGTSRSPDDLRTGTSSAGSKLEGERGRGALGRHCSMRVQTTSSCSIVRIWRYIQGCVAPCSTSVDLVWLRPRAVRRARPAYGPTEGWLAEAEARSAAGCLRSPQVHRGARQGEARRLREARGEEERESKWPERLYPAAGSLARRPSTANRSRAASDRPVTVSPRPAGRSTP